MQNTLSFHSFTMETKTAEAENNYKQMYENSKLERIDDDDDDSNGVKTTWEITK